MIATTQETVTTHLDRFQRMGFLHGESGCLIMKRPCRIEFIRSERMDTDKNLGFK